MGKIGKLLSFLFCFLIGLCGVVWGDEPLSQLATKESHSKFYTDYIAKYYPKARVITNRFFWDMSMDELTVALQEVVDVLAEMPWFYVANTPKGFRITRNWEFITDQCYLIHDFLKRAYLDTETKKIGCVIAKEDGFGLYSEVLFNKKYKRVLSVLFESRVKAVFDFFALSFDYVLKFFNESILFQDQKTAKKKIKELEYIFTMLKSSQYEAEYQEALKTCGQLLRILEDKERKEYGDAWLKKRLGGNTA